ncbi:MAG: alpha/beta hydrolase [Candidatus Onthomonas sp.]
MEKALCSRIAPQLRFRGQFIQALMPEFKACQYEKLNYYCEKLLAGKWLGKKTDCNFTSIRRVDGSDMRLLVVKPKNSRTDGPALLWIHGGGYGIGVPEQDYAFMERFALAGNCAVISPAYRRSCEAPYPAALEDCYLALLYLKNHAAEYGAREDALFIGGDSAGGGLTAALSLYARDQGEVKIAYQMPFYPMLDDRETDSSRDNRMPVWNTASNREGWRAYLGDLYGTDRIPAYAAPARAEDYTGLPPTCTFVGTEEPFYRETCTYVEKLKKAGVAVDFQLFQGCYHGFDLIAPNSEEARQATRFYMDAYGRALKRYHAVGAACL